MVAAAVIVGGVLSTLMPAMVAVALLPAISVAVPLVVWSAPSPRVTDDGHDWTPERASPHVKATVTSALYQPAALAARSTEPEMVGAVLSRLTTAGSVALLPARSTAVPGTGCAAPSVEIVCGAVQEAIPDSASVQSKVTVTSELFQPAAFAAGDRVCPIVGGVRSIRTVAVRGTSMLPALSTLQKASVYVPSASSVIVVPVCSDPPSMV